MGWIDRLILVVGITAVVLTMRALARTIQSVMSTQPATPPPETEGIGPSVEDRAFPRIWSDDVLAEEERDARVTRGAPDHPSDVCTHWDEQDEREALQEQAIRIRRDSQRTG